MKSMYHIELIAKDLEIYLDKTKSFAIAMDLYDKGYCSPKARCKMVPFPKDHASYRCSVCNSIHGAFTAGCSTYCPSCGCLIVR